MLRPSISSWLFFFGALISSHLAPAQQALHGTVNIFVANRNGLVAVTDSQLSVHGRPVTLGQKLFQIDDTTICTIAGFYSSSGPQFGGERPVAAEMPALFARYLQIARPFTADTPLQQKLDVLIGVLAFSLEMVATVDRMNGRKETPDSSDLTLAGYELGQLKILQTTLRPQLAASQYSYSADPTRSVEVKQRVVFLTAGLDRVAQLILADPSSEYSQGAAQLTNYYNKKQENGGIDLSTDELQSVATIAEERSAERYKGVVGGPVQVAVLSNGSISRFDEPVVVDIKLNPYYLAVANDVAFSGTKEAILLQGKVAEFLSNSQISKTTQHLDGLLVTRSKFTDVLLKYDGNPVALFDETNIVTNCQLLLGRGVTRDDRFVVKLLRDYPTIKVVDTSDGR